MPSASLLIAVEGGVDARRAFANIAADAKKTADAMIAHSRRGTTAIIKDYEKITKAALAASLERIRLEQHVNETRLHLTDTAYNAVKNMISQGVVDEKNAAAEKERIYKKLAQDFIKSEEQKTTREESEIRKRTAFERSHSPGSGPGGWGGGGGGSGGRAGGWRERAGRAMSFAGSQMAASTDRAMSAQEQYAAIERSMNLTLTQTTSDRAEIAHRRGQMLAYAQEHNMRFEDIAEAANEAQSQFTALGSRRDSVATRNQRMNSFLSNLGEAHAMGQDPTQFARFAGALATAGMSQDAQTTTMRLMAGLSQRGAIKVGDLSKSSLQSIMGTLGTTVSQLPAGTTAEARDAAMREALVQQVAAEQILSPRGISGGRSGNALLSINQKLTGSRAQEALLAHIENRFGANSQQVRQLFATGPGGERTLKREYQNAYALGETLATMVGGDPTALANMLGPEVRRSDHHAIRQALTAPERAALRALSQKDATGVTGYQAMRDLQEGAALTQRDVDESRPLFEQDATARQTHLKQQAMLNLLGGNEDRAAQLQREREAAHPAFYGIVNSLPGGQFIAQSIFRAQGAAEGAAGTRGTTTGALPAIGTNGLPVAFTGSNINELAKAIGDQMRQNPPVINVDPHTLAHAQAAAATGANAPSPEHRAANR